MSVPVYQLGGIAGIVGLIITIILIIGLIPFLIRLGIKFICKLWKSNDFSHAISNDYVYMVLIRYCATWCAVGLALIILVKAFSQVDLMQGVYLILSYPIAWCAGFLTPTPNGLGIREAVLGMLLSAKYNYELILLITITSRVWTILGEVLAFVLFKLVYSALKLNDELKG